MNGMGTTINWARLEAMGRCKAIGVPWTLEEENAIQGGIPYEYVRLGILNQEDLEKRKEEDEKEFEKTGLVPLVKMEKEDLLSMAHKLNINATSSADKATLIRLIEQENKDSDIKKASKEVKKDKEDGIKRDVKAVVKEAKEAEKKAEEAKEDTSEEVKPKKGKKDEE